MFHRKAEKEKYRSDLGHQKHQLPACSLETPHQAASHLEEPQHPIRPNTWGGHNEGWENMPINLRWCRNLNGEILFNLWNIPSFLQVVFWTAPRIWYLLMFHHFEWLDLRICFTELQLRQGIQCYSAPKTVRHDIHRTTQLRKEQ